MDEARTKGFSRRIKAHVIGPAHPLAIVVPPELAPLCLKEALDVNVPAPRAGGAGVEFNGRLRDAWVCNLWLRTASRVLCRLDSFRAGATEELFHKASRIPWELWLNPEIPLDVETQVERSRISHEGRVAEVIADCVEKGLRGIETVSGGGGGTLGEAPANEGEPRQKILVRLTENHCLISLDTTGVHLHQRGYRLRHTGAPLRETLAAAILLKAEWKAGEPLVDGMCGSGTFPIEAAMIRRKIAPGLGRDFLFQRWPSFQKETWDYLCRKAVEAFLPKAVDTIIGMDIDGDALAVSAENAARAGVADDIGFESMNFFEFKPLKRGLKRGLLVLNPPYGIRLDSDGTSLYERIGAHLKVNFKGWKFAILAGSRAEVASLGVARLRLWNIKHGGIPVIVAFGRI